MFIDKKIKIINYSIALLPVSIIIGNLAINLNLIIILLMGFLIFKKEIFIMEDKKYQYLLYLFFIYLLSNTLVNNILYFNTNDVLKDNFFKSIFFFRFLFLFLILNKLIEKKQFNLDIFYISCAFFSLFLAFDIIFQVIFEKNLIGNTITFRRPSGFFGDEHIAGGYLQKFLLFFIFLITLKYFKNKEKIFYLFIVCFIPIVLTGNRMPALIYCASCVMFYFLEKNFKQIIAIFLILFLIVFALIKNPLYAKFDRQFNVFFQETKELIFVLPKLLDRNYLNNNPLNIEVSPYLVHFNSGIEVWKKNKVFGSGLKSFRINCQYVKNQTCNSHPHNYFLEIMIDTGIIGLIIIYSIFILSVFNYLKFYLGNSEKKLKLITVPFFLIILFEFFPLRSTGSFFTTNNAVVIFLMLALFINFKNLNFLNNLKS